MVSNILHKTKLVHASDQVWDRIGHNQWSWFRPSLGPDSPTLPLGHLPPSCSATLSTTPMLVIPGVTNYFLPASRLGEALEGGSKGCEWAKWAWKGVKVSDTGVQHLSLPTWAFTGTDPSSPIIVSGFTSGQMSSYSIETLSSWNSCAECSEASTAALLHGNVGRIGLPILTTTVWDRLGWEMVPEGIQKAS